MNITNVTNELRMIEVKARAKLEDWLIKNIKKGAEYLEPIRTSPMRLFCENSKQQKAANYFCKIAPPLAFDWALNARLERQIVTQGKSKIC